jgi:Flp pilus assembly protein TadG
MTRRLFPIKGLLKKRFKTKKERGQSLVEFTMSITFLVLLVAGVVDLGRAFFTYIALRDAAQEGAAYASIARIYPIQPMMCTEIMNRARSTSNTQVVDLGETDISINYYDFWDVNLITPYACGSLNPDTSALDRTHTCFGTHVVVRVTYPDFPLATPFLGTLIGSQTVPISAWIEDTVLTPECK